MPADLKQIVRISNGDCRLGHEVLRKECADICTRPMTDEFFRLYFPIFKILTAYFFRNNHDVLVLNMRSIAQYRDIHCDMNYFVLNITEHAATTAQKIAAVLCVSTITRYGRVSVMEFYNLIIMMSEGNNRLNNTQPQALSCAKPSPILRHTHTYIWP